MAKLFALFCFITSGLHGMEGEKYSCFDMMSRDILLLICHWAGTYEMRAANKTWYILCKKYEEDHKKGPREEAIKHIVTLNMLKKTPQLTLGCFTEYWDRHYLAPLFVENINPDDRDKLGRKKTDVGKTLFIGKKTIFAVKRGMIVACSGSIRDIRLLNPQKSSLSYETPIIDKKTGVITIYTLGKYIEEIIYDPRSHTISNSEFAIGHGFPAVYRNILNYPRVFFMCLKLGATYLKPNERASPIRYYNIHGLAVGQNKEVNDDYQMAVRNTFEIGQLAHEMRLLTHLFMLHSGDGRSNKIETYLQGLYNKRAVQPSDERKRTCDEFIWIAKELFFKPIPLQSMHIDDPGEFNRRILRLRDEPKSLEDPICYPIISNPPVKSIPLNFVIEPELLTGVKKQTASAETFLKIVNTSLLPVTDTPPIENATLFPSPHQHIVGIEQPQKPTHETIITKSMIEGTTLTDRRKNYYEVSKQNSGTNQGISWKRYAYIAGMGLGATALIGGGLYLFYKQKNTTVIPSTNMDVATNNMYQLTT